MDILSVASTRSLVKWATLCWYRQRRLPAVQLWWLWLITVLIPLFLMASGAFLPPSVASAEGLSDGSVPTIQVSRQTTPGRRVAVRFRPTPRLGPVSGPG